MYLGDHYVVDALAGALVAVLGVTATRRLLSRPAQTDPAASVVRLPAGVESPGWAAETGR